MITKIFDCPISWCTSSVFEHGGDGSPPNDWMHWGEAEDLVPGLWGTVEAGGSRAAHYVVSHDTDCDEVPHDAESLRALALTFEAAAGRLRERAFYLERINS
ncbi:hypothetical protein [Leucobacter sp. W1038]|uniref:hypothetical protein n=1 Tax=Leucobacter sp. W1038 TaxID=3438281 RepID=UPI003D96F999